MTRRALTSIFTAAALALALPVYAQDKGQAGARPNPSGGSSGSAVSRPSGGGSSGGGGSAVSRPSGDSGSSASRPSPSSSSPRGEYRAPSAPERRTGSASSPRRSGESTGERPRVGATTSSGAAASASDDNGDRRRAVPAYARPRDGRPVIGTAVARTGRPPVFDGGYYYDPFFRYSYYYNRYPYGYYYPGYGFGVGYFYDPWMWGYSSPFYYGGGYSGYGGGAYSGSYYSRRQYRDIGAVRLKVKPEHGQVYVDGYYVGEVDSFDGVFQRLSLESGAHRIEVRAEGYEPEQFEIMVIPGETITYKGELKRKQ